MLTCDEVHGEEWFNERLENGRTSPPEKPWGEEDLADEKGRRGQRLVRSLPSKDDGRTPALAPLVASSYLPACVQVEGIIRAREITIELQYFADYHLCSFDRNAVRILR